MARPLAETRASVSSQEFGLWRAYFAVEPPAGRRLEMAGAVQAARIAASLERKPVDPYELMPFVAAPPREDGEAGIEEQLRGLLER